MGCVYKMTCKETGKSFISYTMSTNLPSPKSNTLLDEDRRKLNVAHFTFTTEVLAHYEDRVLLVDARRRAIVEHGTLAPFGYNATGGRPRSKPMRPSVRTADVESRRHYEKFDPRARIFRLATSNPRRAGALTYAIWDKYEDGMTVEQAVARGVRPVDIKADRDRGHIRVEAA